MSKRVLKKSFRRERASEPRSPHAQIPDAATASRALASPDSRRSAARSLSKPLRGHPRRKAAAGLVALILLLCPTTFSQQTTHFIWALDAGQQSSPSPLIRVYQPDGVELGTLPVPGSAQARALSFDQDGNCFVCRGNEVRILDRTGTDTGVILVPPPGTSKAQDVLVASAAQVWVSWGTQASDSRLCRYDVTGLPPGTLAPLDTFGPDIMDHPRRITAAPGPVPAKIFIANRGLSEILVFDTTPGSENFSVISDLQGNTVGPVGLAYDATKDEVWVVGDWGQTPLIGLFDPNAASPPAALTTVFNYGAGSVPGMDAPANCFYDRFNRLYVAGRSSGGAAPGVYIFEAVSSGTFAHLTTWPSSGSTPVNVIDVEPQPMEVEICGPVDENGDIIIEDNIVHNYKIRAPEFPGAFYVAALSSAWLRSPAPNWLQGDLDPTLTFAAPDPRGLPWTCDFIFNVTTGVFTFGGPAIFGATGTIPCPAAPPPLFPLTNANGLDLNIAAFAGFLDANGEANLLIEYQPLNFPFGSLEGFIFNLSFVTVDLNVSSGVGLIANPVEVRVRTNPMTVTPCP